MFRFFKSFLAALTQNILAAVLIAAITAPVLVGYLLGTLDVMMTFVSSPTPIWLTAVIATSSLLYIRYYKKLPSGFVEAPQPEDYFIEDSGYKWKVVDFKNGHISLDPLPYCLEHEYEYIETPQRQLMCRELLNSECSSKIMDINDLTLSSKMAKSKAQALSKKYETRH